MRLQLRHIEFHRKASCCPGHNHLDIMPNDVFDYTSTIPVLFLWALLGGQHRWEMVSFTPGLCSL